jgi:hypothetical protein
LATIEMMPLKTHQRVSSSDAIVTEYLVRICQHSRYICRSILMQWQIANALIVAKLELLLQRVQFGGVRPELASSELSLGGGGRFSSGLGLDAGAGDCDFMPVASGSRFVDFATCCRKDALVFMTKMCDS